MPIETAIQMRRSLAATWTSTNPVLAAGEWGLETDTKKMKIGDGSTAWTSLTYSVEQTDNLLINSNTISSTNVDGTLDVFFAMGTGLNGGGSCVAIQNDGKILCGGSFLFYKTTSARRIVRINSDGVLDSEFSIGTGFDAEVRCIAIQNDGKILCGGSFTSYNGTARNGIARLNSDGTLDNSFSIGTGFGGGSVTSIAIQNDGKILCVGVFTSYNGTTQNRITRLNSDGTLDESFSIGTGFGWQVLSVAIQNDGKILCGGSFTSYNGITQNRIARLNSDGTLDNSFSIGTGFDDIVFYIAIQNDGKILCGGSFTSYNGTTQNRIARLNSDGTLDNSFSIGTGFGGGVASIAIQNDGKIICVGSFTSYNGTTQNRIARLNSDGTLDESFSIGTGFGGTVSGVAIQIDSKIICVGIFLSYNGTTRNRIARLNSSNITLSPNGTGSVVVTGDVYSNTSKLLSTREYVDAVKQGLDVKNSVRVATTSSTSYRVVASGGGGGAANLISISGLQIDGVSVAVGNRVLVKNTGTFFDSILPDRFGIYTVTSLNVNSISLTRSEDANTSEKVTPGMFVFVEEGTQNADSAWVLATDGPIVLNNTSLTFTQFNGAGQIAAGGGLTKTGNTLNVIGTSNRITVNDDDIDIASTYVGQSSITTLGTIGTGTWQASTIAAAFGGTGITSYTTGDLLYASDSNTLSKLGAGTAKYLLKINSAETAPEWRNIMDGGTP